MTLNSELECYTGGGNMLWCALDQITAAFGGQGLFGLMTGGLVILGMYALSKDVVVSAVVALVFGGILVPALPGQYQALALSIMFAGGVAALFGLANKTILNPGI